MIVQKVKSRDQKVLFLQNFAWSKCGNMNGMWTIIAWGCRNIASLDLEVAFLF